MGQRRYLPFGSDRIVSGASDLADEERFTSQKRIEAGNGNPRRELYCYGARWYLSGVGIFTQPDTIVPDYKNPQSLNRFSYVQNNPLKYSDPTGHRAYTDEIYGSWALDSADPPPVPAPTPAPVQAPTATPTPTTASGTASILSQPSNQAQVGGTMLVIGPDGKPFDSSSIQPPTSLASSTGQLTFLSQAGTATVINNAPDPIGMAVTAIGGGNPNTVTLGPTLIVSSIDLTKSPQVRKHEEGHLTQYWLLGPYYLYVYSGLWLATAASQGKCSHLP